MTTTTPVAVDYADMSTTLVDVLYQEAYEFVGRYLTETTEFEGVEYSNLRDELIAAVNDQLTILWK